MKNIKLYLILLVGVLIIILAFAYGQKDGGEDVVSNIVDWGDIEFIDVLTGDEFKISDFKGKPILLESFAVWCPTCLKQQKEIKKIKDSMGDAIVHISLDIDTNENESLVRKHAQENGFDWIFAISPAEMTRKLIDEFGRSVVNAPAAPVVLICDDQSARFLKKGVKTEEELRLEIEKGCQ